MECLYCQVPLDPIRSEAYGGYCSDEHALWHEVEQTPSEYLLVDTPSPPPRGQGSEAGCAPVKPPLFDDGPFSLKALQPKAVGIEVQVVDWDISVRNWTPVAPLADLFPLELPEAREPEKGSSVPESRIGGIGLDMGAARMPFRKLWPVRASEPRFRIPAWPVKRSLPRQLFGCMVLLATIGLFQASRTGLLTGAGVNSEPKLPLPVQEIRANISQRAAVDLIDDFRGGLDDWQGRSPQLRWIYDADGFVRPRGLAVYRPTRDMTDYSVVFVTQIDQRPLGVAYRISDWSHHYALKVRVLNPGAHPVIQVTRYTVVGSRDLSGVTKSFPIRVKNRSLYHIELNAQASNFTLLADGEIVDYWSDGRYSKGGVGLFGGNGNQARVRSIGVRYQYDWLGRLCALLTSPQQAVADIAWER